MNSQKSNLRATGYKTDKDSSQDSLLDEVELRKKRRVSWGNYRVREYQRPDSIQSPQQVYPMIANQDLVIGPIQKETPLQKILKISYEQDSSIVKRHHSPSDMDISVVPSPISFDTPFQSLRTGFQLVNAFKEEENPHFVLTPVKEEDDDTFGGQTQTPPRPQPVQESTPIPEIIRPRFSLENSRSIVKNWSNQQENLGVRLVQPVNTPLKPRSVRSQQFSSAKKSPRPDYSYQQKISQWQKIQNASQENIQVLNERIKRKLIEINQIKEIQQEVIAKLREINNEQYNKRTVAEQLCKAVAREQSINIDQFEPVDR